MNALRTHWELLMNAACLAAAVVLACVVGPTLDAQSTPYPACQDCGKTALASKE